MSEVKKILSFGEIVWDIFPDKKTVGGAPLNFAYYCNKLGANAKIISAVGDDSNGTLAIDILSNIGLDCSFVSILNGKSTGTVLVSTDEKKYHSFEIVSPAAWDFIPARPTAINFTQNADAFCYGTLARRSECSAHSWEVYAKALSPKCLKVFDINLRQNFYTKSLIEQSLVFADILKINEEELAVLRSLFALAKDDDAGVCKKISEKFSLRYLLYTRAQNGYEIFDASGKIACGKPDRIDFVDSVGAGDSFTAAFTMAILEKMPVIQAAQSAQKLAQTVCSRRGALCL